MSSLSEPVGLVDPFLEGNKRMILRLVKEAFNCVSRGKPFLNFMQAGSGLTFVFEHLHPIMPLPNTTWYNSAFQNYDRDQDGLINLKAFHQIIQQCHKNHCSAILQQSQRYAKYTPHCLSPLTLPAPPRRNRRRRHSWGGRKREDSDYTQGVKLASHIMFPSHHGICQVYKDYKFNEVMGRGSFGKVQRVTQRKTKSERACKTIAIQSFEQWGLIRSEVELLKNLNHPNILKLFETYQDGYAIYLIIELCKGKPLFDKIAKHYETLTQPFTERKVCLWMRQILSACSYCHEREVVHRDLKPENILFVDASDDSPLKVIDFGLSNTMSHLLGTAQPVKRPRLRITSIFTKLLPVLRRSNLLPWMGTKVRMERAGTPHYMAPEMIKGNYDEKCDLFAVGIIMHQLLTGRHPFYVAGRDDEQSCKKKILYYEPVYAGEPWRHISAEAKDLLKKLLQKNPKKRISARASLQHPWFKVMDTRGECLSELTPALFEGLRRWQRVSKLKQAIMYLLAKEHNEWEILGIRRKFEALDIEGRGEITLNALQRVCTEQSVALGLNRPETRVLDGELEKIFNSLDTNRRGHIGYIEFISAFLETQGVAQKAQLREVFDKFDRKRDGRLTLNILRGALQGTRCGSLTEAELMSLFREADRNNDGAFLGLCDACSYLDFNEFCEMMTLKE